MAGKRGGRKKLSGCCQDVLYKRKLNKKKYKINVLKKHHFLPKT